MRSDRIRFFFYTIAILMAICNHTFAQSKDSSLQHLATLATKMFTWDVKGVRSKGYMMFSDIPYNIKDNPHDYISLTVARRYQEQRPAFISFTLPDNVIKEKGITLLFSHELQIDSDSKSFWLPFDKHWSNNHTLTARLWNGFLSENDGSDSVDIFEKMMTDRQLFIIIYDSSGSHKIAIPLSFFKRQYAGLSSSEPAPTYSTGNPKDTALTSEERIDINVYGISNMKASWEIAGINDPIRLKHFIKYFRYLVDHNKKGEIAQLLVYPLDTCIPECKDSAEFVQNYTRVFDKYLKEAIDTVRLNKIFHNYQGVMIGSGPNFWICQAGNKYKIYGLSNAAYLKTKGWVPSANH